jgi:hypothetical protein
MSRLWLFDHFSALDDPCQRGKVLAGGGGRSLWKSAGGGDRGWTLSRGLLPFAQGIPSPDRLNDVRNALDGGLFSEAVAARVEGLREDEPDIVAIDGKTLRRARGGQASAACRRGPGPARATGSGARGDSRKVPQYQYDTASA